MKKRILKKFGHVALRPTIQIEKCCLRDSVTSDLPKQCFIVLPEPNQTSQLKFCFPNQNQTEPNM